MTLTPKRLGKVAYDAYKVCTFGKSLISGNVLPEWDELPIGIRAAWMGSAIAVAGYVIESEQETLELDT